MSVQPDSRPPAAAPWGAAGADLPEASRLVGVRLRSAGRAEDYLVEGEPLRVGDLCVVEGPAGHVVGEVRRPARAVPAARREQRYPRVLRPATPEERAAFRERRERETAAVETCQQRARGRGLAMKIVDVEVGAAGRRLTVYFTAEHRVDFRELVRDLAREFRARVEMRQVGARDVTRLQGGVGPCGRSLCCAGHLRAFEPVSVKMAKAQDVPLNDGRLLGNCGRLKCCLLYEFSLYEELRARLPRVGTACQADCGGGCQAGRVKGVKVLRETVLVGFADGTEAEVPLAALTWEGRPHVQPGR
jgi:cell fate regulator YaaT (PSP1 superfamily)